MCVFVQVLIARRLGPQELGHYAFILSLGAMNNPMFTLKGPAMANGGPYPPAFPLKHQQKDLRLALELGEDVGGSLPVVAAANAAFVEAMKADGSVGNMDFSAVMKNYE